MIILLDPHFTSFDLFIGFSLIFIVPILLLVLLIITFNQCYNQKSVGLIIAQLIFNPIFIILFLMILFNREGSFFKGKSSVFSIIVVVLVIISAIIFILNMIRFYNNLDDPKYPEEDE